MHTPETLTLIASGKITGGRSLRFLRGELFPGPTSGSNSGGPSGNLPRIRISAGSTHPDSEQSFYKGALPFEKPAAAFSRGALPFSMGAIHFDKAGAAFSRGAALLMKGASPFSRGAVPFIRGRAGLI